MSGATQTQTSALDIARPLSIFFGSVRAEATASNISVLSRAYVSRSVILCAPLIRRHTERVTRVAKMTNEPVLATMGRESLCVMSTPLLDNAELMPVEGSQSRDSFGERELMQSIADKFEHSSIREKPVADRLFPEIRRTDRRTGSSAGFPVQNLEVTGEVVLIPESQTQDFPEFMPQPSTSVGDISEETQVTEEVAVDGGVLFRPRTSKSQKSLETATEKAPATQSIPKPMAKAEEIVRHETWESCNPFLTSPVQLRTASSNCLKNAVNQTVCSLLPVMISCSKKSSVNLFSASELHDHLPVKAAEQKETRRLESCTPYETNTQQRRSAFEISYLSYKSAGASVSMAQLEKESGFQSAEWSDCRGVLCNVYHMTRAIECTCPTIWEKEDSILEVEILTPKAVASVLVTNETVAVLSASFYQVQSPAISSSAVCYSNFKLTGVSQYCSALQCEDLLQSPAFKKGSSYLQLHNGRSAVTHHKPALQTVSTYLIPTPTTRCASAAFCLNHKSAGVSVSMVQLDKESGFQSADWNDCRGVLRHVFQMTRATESTRPTTWEKMNALMFRKEKESVARKAIELRVARTAVAVRRGACDSCSPFIASLLHPQTANLISTSPDDMMITHRALIKQHEMIIQSAETYRISNIAVATDVIRWMSVGTLTSTSLLEKESQFMFKEWIVCRASERPVNHVVRVVRLSSPHVWDSGKQFTATRYKESACKVCEIEAVNETMTSESCCFFFMHPISLKMSNLCSTRAALNHSVAIYLPVSWSSSRKSQVHTFWATKSTCQLPVKAEESTVMSSLETCKRFHARKPSKRSAVASIHIFSRQPIDADNIIALQATTPIRVQFPTVVNANTITHLKSMSVGTLTATPLLETELEFEGLQYNVCRASERPVTWIIRVARVSSFPVWYKASQFMSRKYKLSAREVFVAKTVNEAERRESCCLFLTRPVRSQTADLRFEKTARSNSISSYVPVFYSSTEKQSTNLLKAVSSTALPLVKIGTSNVICLMETCETFESQQTQSASITVQQVELWISQCATMTPLGRKAHMHPAAYSSSIKSVSVINAVNKTVACEPCSLYLTDSVHHQTADCRTSRTRQSQAVSSFHPVLSASAGTLSLLMFPSAISTGLLPVKIAEMWEKCSLETCSFAQPSQRRSASAVSCLNCQAVGVSASMVQLDKESGFQSADWNERRGELRHISYITRAAESICPLIWEKEDAFQEVQRLTLKAMASVLITHETVAVFSASLIHIQSPAVRCASAAFCLNPKLVGVSVSMEQLDKESGFQSTDWNKSRGVLRHITHMTRATESTRPAIWEKEDALPAVQTLTVNKTIASVLITHETVFVAFGSVYQVQSQAASRASAVAHLNYLSVAKAGQDAVFSVAGLTGKSLIQRSAKYQVRCQAHAIVSVMTHYHLVTLRSMTRKVPPV